MVSAAEKPLQKQCRIKTSGLLRYQKEYLSYKKEVDLDKEKVAKMEEEGKEISDINKMVFILI